jgi:hypothetical protein
MADQSDAEQALVGLVTAALYPAGTASASVLGPVCRVFRGWPGAVSLQDDLAAGRVTVSVYPVAGSARNTSRFAGRWRVLPAPPPSLSVTVNGNSATFAGVGAAGQLAGIAASGKAYVYQAGAGDTPELAAACLGAYARADMAVAVRGATVTLPGAVSMLARVVTSRTAWRELRRQAITFRISCWCGLPSLRDAAAAALDVALSQVPFIGLADATQGRLRFKGGAVNDSSEAAGLYRRDLDYTVEYATTLQQTQPELLFLLGEINSTSTFIS